MVMNVYDDMVVLERHEVGQGGKLGPDWVMPLGAYKPHPFTRKDTNTFFKAEIGEK